MADPTPPKPLEGTVAPVAVVPLWKHPMVLIGVVIASLPAILAFLVQLHQLPGLPTNVMAWIASAITIISLVITILRNLGLLGTPAITPTAAAKLIQTEAPPPAQ